MKIIRFVFGTYSAENEYNENVSNEEIEEDFQVWLNENGFWEEI